MAMVVATSPAMVHSGKPVSQTPSRLKCSSWAVAMTMASPLTKPNMTGCGTMRTSLPSFNSPNASMMSPDNSTVASRYCAPCCTTSATMTTAIEPAAPDTIPGRPPNSAVIVHRMKAPYKPIKGCRWATSAKAMHSGASANAVVMPASTSARIREAFMSETNSRCSAAGRPRDRDGTARVGVSGPGRAQAARACGAAGGEAWAIRAGMPLRALASAARRRSSGVA